PAEPAVRSGRGGRRGRRHASRARAGRRLVQADRLSPNPEQSLSGAREMQSRVRGFADRKDRQLAATEALDASRFVVTLPMTESRDPATSNSKPAPVRNQSCRYLTAPRWKAPRPMTWPRARGTR